MLFYLAMAYPVNWAFFNPFWKSQCILTKKRCLNFKACFVYKHHIEQLSQFALFAVELFVKHIQNPDQNLPVMKISIQIANFLKFFHFILIDFFQLLFIWDFKLNHSFIGMTVFQNVTVHSISCLFLVFLFSFLDGFCLVLRLQVAF